MIEEIPAALDGQRVDRVVSLLTGLTRSAVSTLVDDGAVNLAGTVVKDRSRRVATGDALEVVIPAHVTSPAVSPEGDVDVPVVYADDAVIVIDKPAGLVVHPGAGHATGTLIAGLLARFPDLQGLSEPGMADRPGVVHRLDKGTSGLLVVARTAAARQALTAQLASRHAERRYRTLVRGKVAADAGLIDAPIRRGEADPTRMAVRAGGKEARTRYRVEARYAEPVEASLLECSLETGRTHQIRVHLAAIGHGVAGDTRYQRHGRWPAGLPRLPRERVWLHAAGLAFDHPVTGERVSFESALPDDLVAVLSALS